MNIRTLIEDFTNQLSSLLERNALDRARTAVESALGGRPGPGRPAKLLSIRGGRPPDEAALPCAGMQEPRGARVRDGLREAQGRLEDADREVPRGASREEDEEAGRQARRTPRQSRGVSGAQTIS